MNDEVGGNWEGVRDWVHLPLSLSLSLSFFPSNFFPHAINEPGQAMQGED